MSKLTPKERETILLEGGTPDRMPIWQLNGIVGSQTFGYEWKDVRFDAKLAVDITRRFADISGTDTLGHTCIEANAMFMDLPGIDVKLVDNNYGNMMSHYYNEAEDVDKKELYDPSDPKKAPWLWKGVMNKSKLLTEIEENRLIHQFSWGVMTTAGFLRNVEALLMDMVLEPELAEKIMDRAAELVNGIMTTGLEYGCDIAYLPDPTSSGSLISGETYENFPGPHMKRMVKNYMNRYKAPAYLHVCGETAPVAKALRDVNPALFSFDYMNDIRELRGLMGDDVILAGNLNPMDVIWQGTPESVIAASKKVIEDSDGKKFILATGCETPRDTPTENLQAMLTAVETYARY